LDAADHLVKKCEADKVYIIATHGVLSGDAIKKIEACDSVYKVILKLKYYFSLLFIL
jgi:ribose-phosphate pyrophosphokinase